ncbi:unnamed protein product [Scytosiphon promiscuus]
MEDALQLEGYLLKEKSKVSRLHGLTGDINRRYFRIRTVEGSPELALCYFKNSTDSEVRGWIYLKDVTEIAEHQDTIILTSAARTLHLYAETRGKHNGWVTGLAELCPGAIKILGRNALTKKTTDAPPTESSAFTLPTTSAPIGTSFARDEHHTPNETPATDNLLPLVDPQARGAVDSEESSSSNDAHASRLEFQAPREDVTRVKRRNDRCRGNGTGGQQGVEEHRMSRSTPPQDLTFMTGRHEERGNYCFNQMNHRCGAKQLGPSNGYSGLRGKDGKGKKHCRKEERRGCRSGESEFQSTEIAGTIGKQDQILEGTGSQTSGRKGADDIVDGRNERYPWFVSRRGCVRDLEARGSTRIEQGNVENKRSADRDSVEIIELRETTCHDNQHTERHVLQRSGKSGGADIQERNNQDEEKEFDEEADIDLVVPIEVGAWEVPHHQWQSATSRLHRHISRPGEKNTGTCNIPPPKEFLANTSLNPLTVPTVAGHITEAGQGHDSTSTRSANLGTKCTRRRTAADLEWNDEGGTPDRPSRTEGRLAQPAICETVDLGDCEERRCDDWDAEIDEQRRRAAAAVLALQVAVKEADEEAHVQSRALGDLKQRGTSDARRMGAKYPSPPGPPPAALIRKTRRASAGPIPWVAPAEALSPAPDNFISNDRITSNDRDDEVNALSHGSAVKGAR